MGLGIGKGLSAADQPVDQLDASLDVQVREGRRRHVAVLTLEAVPVDGTA